MEIRKINRRFRQLIIRGDEVVELDQQLLEKVASCYRRTFNESWGEAWTDEASLKEIRDSFRSEKSREFVGTLVLQGEEVVGFSWGIVADIKAVSLERDFPFGISQEEREEALQALLRWLKVSGQDDGKVLIFREGGALKFARGRISGFLAVHVLQEAIKRGAKKTFLWTSPRSVAFGLCLGLFWRPIFFFENDCLIMAGSIEYAYNLAKIILSRNPLRIWLGYRKLKRNIRTFFS